MPVTVVGELTADQSSIILMATGADWEIAEAAKLVQTLTPLVKQTNPPGALTLPASWPAVVQLSATFGAAWQPGPALTAWTAEQVRARTQPPTALRVTPPAGFVPRSYQVEGACLIGSTGRALIFDDPRTGKTISAILGLVERYAVAPNDVLPVIIVCPAAVIDAWVRHVHDWTHGWRAVAWRGSPKQREKLIGTAHVYVTSFETARRDASDKPRSPLRRIGHRGLIVDEFHRTKNSTAAQTLAVNRLARPAQTFVALSGTPITHGPDDMLPALQGLEPHAWPSGERWAHRYCLTAPGGDYSVKVLGLNPATENEFRLTLLGRHRRVARQDVIEEVPKTYSTRIVELPDVWRQAYDDIESGMLAELPDGGELSVMGVLSQMNLLSLLASSPADMEITYETVIDPETGLEYEKAHRHAILKPDSWKVEELLEVLAERAGYAVAAFADSRQLMMMAGDAAAKAGHRVGYVVGGQSAKVRTATVDTFQARQLDLLCVTTKAGGTGLTLSAADTLVFLQRPWSLIDSMQAEDRAEGVLKERGTEIIDIVARNTIETRVRQVLHERAGTLSQLLRDPRIVAQLFGGAEVRDLRKAKVSTVAAERTGRRELVTVGVSA